jgi:cytochrome c oxidase subunit 4
MNANAQVQKHEHHISSARQLWAIGIALMFLTVLTVVVSDLGIPAPYNLVAALLIAGGKAFLVAAFFMNLYWDTKFNAMLLIAAFLFFLLMVSITLLDTL